MTKSEYMAEYRAKNADRIRQQRAEYRAKNADVLAEKFRLWAKDNADGRAEYMKSWREKNPPDRPKRVVRSPAEKARMVAERYAAWVKANPERWSAITGRRRAAKLRARINQDEEFLLLVDSEAHLLRRLRFEATGIKWEVDHIVPLQGKRVCGLHVPQNLQVIPAVMNRSKSNKFGEGI